MWLLFEEQHKPFINYFDRLGLIKIMDENLEDMLSYMLYEIPDKWGLIAYPDGSEIFITKNAQGLVNYYKFEWLLLPSENRDG